MIRGKCKECQSDAYVEITPAGYVIGIIGFTVGSYLTLRFLRRKFCPNVAVRSAEEAKRQANLTMLRASRWIVKFKIAVSFLQVASTIATQYEILFPNAVLVITGWFDWVNLSFFSLFRLGCKAHLFDHFDNVIIVTLVPIAIVLLNAMAYLLLKCPCVSKTTRIRFQRIPFLVILVTCFLSYSAVSSSIVKSFRCLNFDGGLSLLRAGACTHVLTLAPCDVARIVAAGLFLRR